MAERIPSPDMSRGSDWKAFAAGGALWLAMGAAPTLSHLMSPEAATVSARRIRPAEAALPAPKPLAPGPEALRTRLDEVAKRVGGKVGIAVAAVEEGWLV